MNDEWQNFVNRVHAKPFPEDRDFPTVRSSVKGANGRSLIDSWEPKTSSDQRVSRLSFHPKRGSTEWFEYEFEIPQEITTVGVYWFDEAQAAASFRNERKDLCKRIPGFGTEAESRKPLSTCEAEICQPNIRHWDQNSFAAVKWP